MHNVARLARLLLACVAFVAATGVHSYNLDSFPPGNRAIMSVNMGTTPIQFIGGTFTWSQAAHQGMFTWNQTGIGPGLDHSFFLLTSTTVVGDACSLDGVSEVRFSQSVCGVGYGDALAITIRRSRGDVAVESDMVFDSAQSWNGYNGPLQSANGGGTLYDIFRVALHEMGHVAGLDHPDDIGQSVAAVMNSRVSDTYQLQADDVAGAHAIAWGSGPVPCSYTISPASNSIAAAGGTGTVAVATSTGCAWTAGSAVSWVTITSGSSGSGAGTVGYAVAANSTTAQRSGTITVAGQSFTLTQAAGSTASATRTAVEFFHAGFGHYFVSADPDEINKLDTGFFVGWARTTQSFQVFESGANLVDVCRFFTVTFAPKSSHFYTPIAFECAKVKNNPDWLYEKIAFKAALPVGGVCPAGTQILHRLYNDGRTGAPNHRYTISAQIRAQMIANGFIPEDANASCVPL